MRHRLSPSQTIRVCHVAMGDLWAGAEVHLVTLISDLAKRPGLDISVVLFNGGRLEQLLKSLGIQVRIFPESEWTEARILTMLIHYFRRAYFDIIHTHNYKDNLLGTVAAKLAQIPHVVRTIHGLTEPFTGFKSMKMRLYTSIDSFTCRHFTEKIIVVSDATRQSLRWKYPPEKVIRIHNGIDLAKVKFTRSRTNTRLQLGVSKDSCLFGTAGRLMAVKGHEHLLRAIRKLSDERSNVKLVIIGDGPLRDRLENLAKQLGIADNVAFLGHRDDTYDLLNALDVFVLPSLSEGIPLVILEAMATSRPVIASRVGGIPEVIEHGKNGLLVSPGHDGEIAEWCKALMDDCNFAQKLGCAGKQRVEEKFSSRAMGDKVAELYQTLVNDGRVR